MNDHSLMPFGKYQGLKLGDVPASYLLFLYDRQIVQGKLRAYIQELLPFLQIRNKSRPNQHLSTMRYIAK